MNYHERIAAYEREIEKLNREELTTRHCITALLAMAALFLAAAPAWVAAVYAVTVAGWLTFLHYFPE